ncbi:uncharacterized protein MONBRDRAFT_9540 [Monosiga brevicollis MX1]|uniref:NodB homology domain-containing protein n=1 Tax=Monosiga brevicollis TaxID=81824 RepID=A9V3M3_MONBE|nr:uncharacterized protein MONBRDRAFT_9540 [Monosiga brevicollis MX1]EDQ87726.1 predicted protein [Monosiga brevicollis MX1]|eukprot:XP_001747259.1 hypothetical protein [Monosiga brevicollis MX1]
MRAIVDLVVCGLPYGTNNYNPATSDPNGPKNYNINFLLQFRLQMAHILTRAPRVVHRDHADSESEFFQLKGSSEPPEPVVRGYVARSGNRDRIRALGLKSRCGGGGGITELSFLKTSVKTVRCTKLEEGSMASISPGTTIVTNHDPDHDHEHDDSDDTLYSGLPYGTNNYNPATSDPNGPKNYNINFLLQFRLQMAHILTRAPRVVHRDHADSESEFFQLKGLSEPPEPVTVRCTKLEEGSMASISPDTTIVANHDPNHDHDHDHHAVYNMARKKVHDRLAAREASLADMHAAYNRPMYKAMAISRARGGPYTFDELSEDYDYSELCLCTPCRCLLFVLVTAAAVFATLFFTGMILAVATGNTTVVSDAFQDTLPPPLEINAARTDPCNTETCQLPDCFCNNRFAVPRELPVSDIPQLVTITFDDAITVNNYNYYQSLFGSRVNPNGCPAAATFYISHEYTNYRLVQALYREGHEIGLHTISHSYNLDWQPEVYGMRQILYEFAGIPSDEVGQPTLCPSFLASSLCLALPFSPLSPLPFSRATTLTGRGRPCRFVSQWQMHGFRAPFLLPGGDAMLSVLSQSGLTHDSSFLAPTTPTGERMFPFTLEFPFEMPCMVEECPSDLSFPKLWELPVHEWWAPGNPNISYGSVDWQAPPVMISKGVSYSFVLFASQNVLLRRFPDETQPSTQQEVLDLLRYNFYAHYNQNRAPFTVPLHASWFDRYPFAFKALQEFLDELAILPEVYLVDHHKVVEWMRQPTRLSNMADFAPFQCDSAVRVAFDQCTATEQHQCGYTSPEDGSDIYMATCRTCPDSYPWLNNPLGV